MVLLLDVWLLIHQCVFLGHSILGDLKSEIHPLAMPLLKHIIAYPEYSEAVHFFGSCLVASRFNMIKRCYLSGHFKPVLDENVKM